MSDLYVEPTRDVHPKCRLPDDRTATVWRYMDWWKFESLLSKRSLYFRRADLLEDKFEGTYSRSQLGDMEQWIEKVTNPGQVVEEREAREHDRRRSYINCWCLGETDFDLMWKGYVREPLGVAVKSTVAKLEAACDLAIEKWPLDISLVGYFDHAGGQWIDYFGTPGVFFWKDLHFKLENEIRIIHWPNITDSPPENVWVPVKLDILIDAVVMSPKTPEHHAKCTKLLLEKMGLHHIPVLYSRDDRPAYV